MNDFTSPTFQTKTERDLAMELVREIAASAEVVDLTEEVEEVSELGN